MTPLIDMGFLLIVFFALVSHLVVVDAAKVDLPRPSPSAAGRAGDQPRAVINALCDDSGRLVAFRLSGRDFAPDAEGLGGIGDSLALLLREQPLTELSLRADRRLAWRELAPLFEAVSRAAVVSTPGRPAKMRLVVAEGHPS